jgi:hypothetical protein
MGVICRGVECPGETCLEFFLFRFLFLLIPPHFRVARRKIKRKRKRMSRGAEDGSASRGGYSHSMVAGGLLLMS